MDPMIEFKRIVCINYIKDILTKTDTWIIRSIEDSTTLRIDRRQYRVALRNSLANILTADDPSTVILPGEPQFDGSISPPILLADLIKANLPPVV